MKNTLAAALANWDSVYEFKARFIAKNTDPEGGDPLCGYTDWDEYMTDINYDLADAGEILAEAIREALK